MSKTRQELEREIASLTALLNESKATHAYRMTQDELEAAEKAKRLQDAADRAFLEAQKRRITAEKDATNACLKFAEALSAMPGMSDIGLGNVCWANVGLVGERTRIRVVKERY